MTLLDRFRQHLGTLQLSPGPALVPVSGGPDSVALLDLLVTTRETHRHDLIVAHADHGIHPDSSLVADQVRALADRFHLPFETTRLGLGANASETAARTARYDWLEVTRERLQARYIVTAHHADDQVETVLMRVLAGSGPAGLAGMAPITGTLVRPLLPFGHGELLQHLEERGLTAWTDPANSDPRHLRSWIRTELLPTIRARLPDVDAKLQRTGRQAGKDRAAWDELLDQLPGLDLRPEYDGISVAAPVLAGYDSSLVQAVICAIARRAGCRLGPARFTRVLELLSSGSSGDRVPLGGQWTGELTFGRLRLVQSEAQEPADSWSLAGNAGRGAWGRWRFRWELGTVPQEQTRSGMRAWFTPSPITVRSWVPGEKLKPLGGTGRRLIVRCFQEERVPRALRGAWPVLAQGEEVMWVPGVCRSDARVPSPGTEALRVDAEYA